MSRTRAAAIFCLALAVLGTGGLNAQVTGEIEGAVADDSGGALPGVTVTATNEETGRSRTAISNAEGFYDLKAIASGTYTVSASLDGFQTTLKPGIKVFTGQVVTVDLSLQVGQVTESITVTGESPIVETARSSAAAYVGEKEIEALPISGRDFTDFAFLTPTVQRDSVRGFVTMSGQRGIYSGLNIDGTDAKSAFFAYGRGGEATENDGLVVAQDTVKEFQVVVNGFAPEYGTSGGGYINVITKGGTNELKGNAFFYTRDEGLKSDLERSPLDQFFGRTDVIEPDEFSRDNYGASIGGPIKKDQTHYFFSFDQTDRTEPFSRSINARGFYDAILVRAQTDPRFAALVDGYTPRDDGVAAPDPVNGRTATGLFQRDVDNLILFGKIDHQINDANTFTGRLNLTDYERFSTFADEESEKLEDTMSLVVQNVSVIGSNKVNEFRIQLAEDNLDRLSTRVGQGIEAEIDYRARGADSGNSSASIGKFNFLPIFVEEEKLQIQNNFSYLFGNHDTKFGIDYQKDDLAQLFAGRRDGEYDFDTLEDFINNDAAFVEIFFGDVTFPNYDEAQEVYALYAQDSYKANANLSINYGIRYSGTKNPDDLPHLFEEGRDIPDDTDNIAPRFGFAWTPDAEGKSVVRGGIGMFFGRTPSLVFASQVQENGLFPNAGRVGVRPGDIGFVPLGDDIDNENPPLGIAVAAGFVDPNYEDAETLRINLGYEREFMPNWSYGVDLIWADGDNLLENIDINRTFTTDAAGRPIYSSRRPLTRGDVTGEADDTPLAEVLTRQSIGESEYRALTFSVKKRFSDRYQIQAHYTYAEDKDTSSNERSATSVTLLRPDDPRYDFGFSERDIRNRLVVSGLVELPWDFTLSGIYEYRGGTPFNPVDRGADFPNCGFTALGFDCPDIRPIGDDGNVLGRNSFRNESFDRLDLRIGKFFEFGGRYRADVFFEVFNVFDDQEFEVDGSFRGDRQRDPTNSQFGLASSRVLDSREMQIGIRFSY